MSKTLTDIDGSLTAQRVDVKPHPSKNVDTAFGIYMRQDGKLAMRNEVVHINRNKRALSVDDKEYDFTPGLHALIMSKHPRPSQYDSNNYRDINLFVHRPRLDHSRIRQVLLDHTLHGNISICSGKWLYLEKG